MNGQEQAPLVSVQVLTYCHEKYIRRALDSILAQKADFDFEVLVGDDASTDGTQDILKEYGEKYPGIIKPVLRDENIGTTRNGYDIRERARGKYLAFLDGDDYWTDENKLQMQIDFLKANPQYIGCCHKCVVVDANDVPDYTAFPHWTRCKKVFTLNDYIEKWELPGQTGTVVIRNIFLDKQTDFTAMYKLHSYVGDKTMFLFLLTRGDFYCFNKVMSAYRFVVDGNAKNWFSLHHADPYWQYSAFMHPCRLEAFARDELGVKASIGPRKDYHFMSFLDDFRKQPSLKRLGMICNMIAGSHNPVKYAAMLVKYVIER